MGLVGVGHFKERDWWVRSWNMLRRTQLRRNGGNPVFLLRAVRGWAAPGLPVDPRPR